MSMDLTYTPSPPLFLSQLEHLSSHGSPHLCWKIQDLLPIEAVYFDFPKQEIKVCGLGSLTGKSHDHI